MRTIQLKNVLVLSLLLFCTSIKAQEDLTMYSMNNVQQSLYVNPAIKLKHKVNIGLPIISSVYFDVINNAFNPKHAFDVNSNGVTTITTQSLIDKWKPRNYLGVNARLDLLSFGFTLNEKNYISFSLRDNFMYRLTLPEGLLELPLVGNANFDENDGIVDLEGLGMDVNYYRSWGVGYQREVNKKLRLGGAFRFNQGIANVHFKRSDLRWETDPNTYDYTFSGAVDVRTSGYDSTLDGSNLQSLLINPQNIGFGLDLGAVYQLNDKIELSASLIDLGFITWKQNINNFVSEELNSTFEGLDFTNTIINGGSPFDADSLADVYFADLDENQDRYTTSLLTKLYLGAAYSVFEKEHFKGRANLLLQGGLYHGKLLPSVTLGYTQDVYSFLQASINYSYVNRGNNIGFGLSANLFPVQVYVTVDNLLAARYTEIVDANQEVVVPFVPYNAKKLHVRFGINLSFGRKEKDRDKDGVKNRKDDCPDTYGLMVFKGCPDADGDGIMDKDDDCPEIAGLEKFNGCPDTDSDGIPDEKDACPEVAGLNAFNGCPDSDNDEVMDSEDDCPNIAGLKMFNGCPDSDSDGIKDSEDDCPNNYGPKEFNGCPDTDKDGVLDYLDNCPETAGPKENNGCPWLDTDSDGLKDNEDKCPYLAGPISNQGCPLQDTDADGIPNAEDKCPATPGTVENNGCPEIEEEVQEIINTAFDNLQFETGKDVIKSSSFESLDNLAKLLTDKPEWKLQIAGHTDDVGNAQSNLILSKKRAEAVKKYISDKGVNKDRIFALYFGETQPISDNATAEGRAKNRRVEMTIVFD